MPESEPAQGGRVDGWATTCPQSWNLLNREVRVATCVGRALYGLVDCCQILRPDVGSGWGRGTRSLHSRTARKIGMSSCSLPGNEKRPRRNSARSQIPLLPRYLQVFRSSSVFSPVSLGCPEIHQSVCQEGITHSYWSSGLSQDFARGWQGFEHTFQALPSGCLRDFNGSDCKPPPALLVGFDV